MAMTKNLIYYICLIYIMSYKYPKISDDDFYKRINKIYKKFTIPKKKKTFNEICFPKNYQLQLPQQFVSKYINPNTPYTGLLLYHNIGSGEYLPK